MSIDDGGSTGSGGALSDSVSFDITVTSVNDDPTATNTSQTVSYTEDDGATDLTDIVITDTDADNDTPDTFTVSLTLSDASAGTLSAASGTGESFDSGTGVWSISAASLADANTALADVSFTPAADYDKDASIAVAISDSAGGSISDTIILDVTAENEAPNSHKYRSDFDLYRG